MIAFAGIPRRKLLAALAIALSAMCLLCGYEFIRSVSESLFIEAYTADRLPMVMALAPLGTLGFIYGYGLLLSYAGARRAVFYTSFLTALGIMLACLAIHAGSKPATVFLHVLRESYIVILVEQIWAFINSTVRRDEGAKLNGPICGIASLGAVAGGFFVQHYAQILGSANLLVFAAASLLPTGILAVVAYEVGGEPAPAPDEQRGRQGHLGVGVLFRNGALVRLAVLIVLTQVVSTMTDLQFKRQVAQVLVDTDERTRWFGGFYAWLNMGSACLQFVVAPALLSWVPLRVIHAAIPLVHIGTCVLSLVKPSLGSATAAYAGFKALDYSVFRAAKELLYIPFSYDARYRAKELIDAFGYRFAKGGVSTILMTVKQVMAISPMTYPIVAIAASMAWLPLAVQLTKRGSMSETPKVER